ncbi:hypothetical protein ACFFUS_10190 [Vibrio gallaecicus]|uniref:hypothetical protein n=1 Tax=Vibrio gallaecicus TaxID=552386 RepID=UPI0010C9DFD8|nr:hypothetical protein [Vibrio gallaecicus]MDN3616836.1 hypothetical protein [Vibrio gallaecicus]
MLRISTPTLYTASLANQLLTRISSVSRRTASLTSLLVLALLPQTSVAKQNSNLWFEPVDIALPRQMDTGLLTDNLRYTLMPTDHTGMAVQITTAVNPSQPIILNFETEQQAFDSMEELKNKIEQVSTNDQDVSLVIVGDFRTGKLKRTLYKTFSDNNGYIEIEREHSQSIANSSAPNFEELTINVVKSATSISMTVLSHVDLEDSKKAQREKLTREISNRALTHRLEQAYQDKQIMFTSVDTSEVVVFDEQIMTTTIVELNSEMDINNAYLVMQEAVEDIVNIGITRNEFKQELVNIRVALKEELDQTLLQTASDISLSVINQDVYIQPSDKLMFFDYHIAHMSETDVNETLHQVWAEGSSVHVSKGKNEEFDSALNLSLSK